MLLDILVSCHNYNPDAQRNFAPLALSRYRSIG
jgi:hypothetical protein